MDNETNKSSGSGKHRPGDDMLDRTEKLLRTQGRAKLSADFKRNVMAEISSLPDPDLLQQPAPGWRSLGASSWAAIALVLAALTGMLWPGMADLLTVWGYEMTDFSLSITFGETILSASMFSIAVFAMGAIMMAGIGWFGARNRLISI